MLIRRLAACVCVLLCTLGCRHDGLPKSEADVEKWSTACANRLVAEAAEWYDGLDTTLSEDELSFSVEVFLSTAGWLKTYRLVMDRQGVAIDVTWDNEFWDAASAVMSADALKKWKVYSVRTLDQVLVATGIMPPRSWSDVSALPVLATIATNSGMPPEAAMSTLDRLIPLPVRKPVTIRLLTVMPEFPIVADFAQSPSR